MKCQELIDKLVETTQRYGDLEVTIYLSRHVRFDVKSAEPCSNKDHFLIVIGNADLEAALSD